MTGQKSTAKKTEGPPVVWGDWDKETVHLDFDKTPLCEVKLWAYRTCFWFKLEGFMILLSSVKEYVVKLKGNVVYRYLKGSYLVVFAKPVRWEHNVKVMNWTALESGNADLNRYVRMQCIKQTSTVRFSAKGSKPAPRVVFKFGTQYRQIKKFLETRRFVLSSLNRMKKDSQTYKGCENSARG
jgi:hypothetical protein